MVYKNIGIHTLSQELLLLKINILFCQISVLHLSASWLKMTHKLIALSCETCSHTTGPGDIGTTCIKQQV